MAAKMCIAILLLSSACAPGYRPPVESLPANTYEAGELCMWESAVAGASEVCGYIDMRGVYALGVQVSVTTRKESDTAKIYFDCTTERMPPGKCVYSDVTRYVAGFPEVRAKNYYFAFLTTSIPIPARTCRLRYSIDSDMYSGHRVSAQYVKLGAPVVAMEVQP